MVLILLVTLACFALAASGDQFEEDDLSFLQIDSFSQFHNYLYLISLPIGLALGILFRILRLEFLKSHIGEKRPAPAGRRLGFTWMLCLLQTAFTRLCNAVFLLLRPGRVEAPSNSHLVLMRDRSTWSRAKKCFQFILGGL